MSIFLEVNGSQYTQFNSARVDLRLDALTNTFSFEATSSGNSSLPFTGGELCSVVVDNKKVLTGYIEVVEVNYSSRSHTISLSGRDKTGDLLDSTLDAISDINPPISLKQIIELVISSLGLSIEVVDTVSPPKFNRAEDIISPEPGQNAFEFIEQYARKRQVILSSNGDGNILITKSSGEFISSRIRHSLQSNQNNVLESSTSYDSTGRYNLYKFSSSMNPIALNLSGKINNSEVVNQSGSAKDSSIRSGRQLVLISENPFSNSQDVARAEWEANIRKSRGRVYSCVLDGFSGDGGIWDVNKIVSVVDDFAGINSRMLINSVSFSFDLSTGSQTSLGLIDQNAYTLSLSEPKTEEVGSGLFS